METYKGKAIDRLAFANEFFGPYTHLPLHFDLEEQSTKITWEFELTIISIKKSKANDIYDHDHFQITGYSKTGPYAFQCTSSYGDEPCGNFEGVMSYEKNELIITLPDYSKEKRINRPKI